MQKASIMFAHVSEVFRDPDKRFALKIASFMAVIFGLKCALYNWADPKLTTYCANGVCYGAREHPLGHWVYLFSVPLFVGYYLLLDNKYSYLLKCGAILLFTVVVTVFLSIINFNPPFPNFGFLSFMLQLVFCSVFAIWARYVDADFSVVADTSIEEHARIEWVKEKLSFWRSLTISATLGYFWILIPWMRSQDVEAARVVTDPDEVRIVEEVFRLQQWMLFAFILCGPIGEAINKMRTITGLLLLFKKRTRRLPRLKAEQTGHSVSLD